MYCCISPTNMNDSQRDVCRALLARSAAGEWIKNSLADVYQPSLDCVEYEQFMISREWLADRMDFDSVIYQFKRLVRIVLNGLDAPADLCTIDYARNLVYEDLSFFQLMISYMDCYISPDLRNQDILDR